MTNKTTAETGSAWPIRCAAAGSGAIEVIRRGVEQAEFGLSGFLTTTLNEREKAALTAAIYDRQATGPSTTALFPWESRWFAARLPPAPATLLLGAAGEGRELRELVAMGYTVDAFEPAASAAKLATDGNDGRAVLVGDYESFSAAILDGQNNALAPLARRRYAAVLFGWGSLSHVLSAAQRQRLIASSLRVCPQGPLLASFWLSEAPRQAGRAERLGARIGAGLRRLRSAADEQTPFDPHETFHSFCGFGHHFTRDEIDALANVVGRRVIWESGFYTHVTFVPPSGS